MVKAHKVVIVKNHIVKKNIVNALVQEDNVDNIVIVATVITNYKNSKIRLDNKKMLQW